MFAVGAAIVDELEMVTVVTPGPVPPPPAARITPFSSISQPYVEDCS